MTTSHPIATEYRNRNPKGHWFDPESMRFFKSHIGSCKVNGDRWYFVTSEKPPHGPRRYSVRVMDGEGEIETIGKFCALTRSRANRLMERAAQQATDGRAHLYGHWIMEALAESNRETADNCAESIGAKLEGAGAEPDVVWPDGRRQTWAEFAQWAILDEPR